ncbi:MAG TPA: 5'/3'-nucleotidase SurE [Firmicutes bacterium]|nr:5'/3'-nucleotidase SurE [Bacillota bacterium]
MHILLTNDDGIYAPGIASLTSALLPVAQITVVAPDRERSATGHAITMHKPLRAEEVQLEVEGGRGKGWAVSGTPSDCVKMAVKVLLPEPPDLIISGINRGPNLGTDILYSGTVSAAIEGILFDIPSLAVSLTTFTPSSFTTAAQVTKIIVDQVKNRSLPPRTLLNINIPPLPLQELQGIKVTKLGFREYENIFEERLDPWGKVYYWMRGDAVDRDDDLEDIDTAAVKKGFVSVTPVQFDLTNYALLEEVKNWKLSLGNLKGE